ncbi:MAG: hypothetical protein ACNA8W_20995 [Bradymonadaceae bacterium]
MKKLVLITPCMISLISLISLISVSCRFDGGSLPILIGEVGQVADSGPIADVDPVDIGFSEDSLDDEDDVLDIREELLPDSQEDTEDEPPSSWQSCSTTSADCLDDDIYEPNGSYVAAYQITPEGRAFFGCEVWNDPDTFVGLEKLSLEAKMCPSSRDYFTIWYHPCTFEQRVTIEFRLLNDECREQRDDVFIEVRGNGDSPCMERDDDAVQYFCAMETSNDVWRRFTVLYPKQTGHLNWQPGGQSQIRVYGLEGMRADYELRLSVEKL